MKNRKLLLGVSTLTILLVIASTYATIANKPLCIIKEPFSCNIKSGKLVLTTSQPVDNAAVTIKNKDCTSQERHDKFTQLESECSSKNTEITIIYGEQRNIVTGEII